MEEELIEAVRRRPSLWNLELERYHDAPYRNVLWMEITEQLGHYFSTPEAATTKWNNLRDSYRRAKKRIKQKRSGDSLADSKLHDNKYKWAKQMSFLDKHTPNET